MEKEITAKSSKHEIIEAYNELLTKVKEQNNTNSRAINEKEEHKKNVDSASEHSQESIVKNISNLKLGLGQSLDLIEKSLVDEFKKLTSLQDAIVYEENRLKDMYEIIATAETLETLILTHKEKKLKLEEEFKQQSAELEQIMEKMKADWEKENTQNEINQKEYLVNLKKQRTRDEEEYHYTLQIERKKEEDLFHNCGSYYTPRTIIGFSEAYKMDFLSDISKQSLEHCIFLKCTNKCIIQSVKPFWCKEVYCENNDSDLYNEYKNKKLFSSFSDFWE